MDKFLFHQSMTFLVEEQTDGITAINARSFHQTGDTFQRTVIVITIVPRHRHWHRLPHCLWSLM